MKNWLMLALASVTAGFATAATGQFTPPEPEVFARAEDQQRARLLAKPCTKADVGRGCYYAREFLVREAPCTFHIDATTNGSLPVDQCYKMDVPRRYRGVWIDAFEGQQFIPDGAKEPQWPNGNLTSPDTRKKFEQARSETIWLSVGQVQLGHDFNNGNGRRMLIDFIGRRTRFAGRYGHMGMSGREIVVDRVISLRECPKAGACG
jgi:hypothetical protein